MAFFFLFKATLSFCIYYLIFFKCGLVGLSFLGSLCLSELVLGYMYCFGKNVS